MISHERGKGKKHHWLFNASRSKGRRIVESCLCLDIRQWHRKGLLIGGLSFSWPVDGWDLHPLCVTVEDTHVQLRFHHDKYGPLTEHVAVEWTPCHYGGRRPWFRCPGVGGEEQCGKRVAILYLVRRWFLCRHCSGLVYRSQREDRLGRLQTQARQLRKRLGGSEALAAPFPPKPKHMHWRTYEQLQQQILKIDLALRQETQKRFHNVQQTAEHLVHRLTSLRR